MPQPKVDEKVRAGVFMMFAEEPPPTTKKIRERLTSAADEAAKAGRPWPFTVPAERTIRRLRGIFQDDLKDEDRSQYRELKWPETLELGVAITDLPWDASPAVLELLAFLQREGSPRPTIRHGKWFWRITIAAPDAPLPGRVFTSRILAAQEAAGLPLAKDLRRVEGFLAFAHWRSDENKKDYRAAIDKGIVPYPVLQPGPFHVSHLPDELRGLVDLLDLVKGDN